MPINYQRMIWEGWTVQDFINELEPSADTIMRGESFTRPFSSRSELKKWCIDNQPYYKHHIPDVVDYFAAKYQLR